MAYNPIVPPWPQCLNLNSYIRGYSDAEILCWVIDQLNVLNDRVNGISDAILADAKAYTDEQIQGFKDQFQALTEQVYKALGQLETENAQFEKYVTDSINAMNAKVDSFTQTVESEVQSMRAYTDNAINENNGYILEQISSQLIGIKVINYFTGEPITIQDMFDLLAQYHLSAPLTYLQLNGRNKTYAELSALDVTYSDLISNAANVVPA